MALHTHQHFDELWYMCLSSCHTPLAPPLCLILTFLHHTIMVPYPLLPPPSPSPHTIIILGWCPVEGVDQLWVHHQTALPFVVHIPKLLLDNSLLVIFDEAAAAGIHWKGGGGGVGRREGEREGGEGGRREEGKGRERGREEGKGRERGRKEVSWEGGFKGDRI